MMEDLKEEMLEKIAQCSNNITVGEVCEIFVHCMEGLEEQTDLVKDIRAKVSEGKYNAFINAILFSFFSAIYLNCDITEEEQKKRLKEFYKAFSDKIKAVGFSKKPKSYDA